MQLSSSERYPCGSDAQEHLGPAPGTARLARLSGRPVGQSSTRGRCAQGWIGREPVPTDDEGNLPARFGQRLRQLRRGDCQRKAHPAWHGGWRSPARRRAPRSGGNRGLPCVALRRRRPCLPVDDPCRQAHRRELRRAQRADVCRWNQVARLRGLGLPRGPEWLHAYGRGSLSGLPRTQVYCVHPSVLPEVCRLPKRAEVRAGVELNRRKRRSQL